MVAGGAVMSTDNAYVQADMVGLSTDVSGIVTEVLVRDNQKVAKGDVLFKLDDLQFRLALNRAEAQIGIRGMTLPRFRPVIATCRPRLGKPRLMSTTITSTSGVNSNWWSITLPRRRPSMLPGIPCKGHSKSLPRWSSSLPVLPLI